MRIFIALFDTPQFQWHFSKYNALDLCNKIREREDEAISDVAKEVCENVILDQSQDGNNFYTP